MTYFQQFANISGHTVLLSGVKQEPQPHYAIECKTPISPAFSATLGNSLCLLQVTHEGEDLCVADKQGLGSMDGLSFIGAGLEQLNCAITHETLVVNLGLELLYLCILLGVCVFVRRYIRMYVDN